MHQNGLLPTRLWDDDIRFEYEANQIDPEPNVQGDKLMEI
jgi:hypothetical protein